jgi:hypothetical protein
MAQQIQDTAYGLSQAILAVNPNPIISVRNPKTNDKAQLGQMWINKNTAIVFFLARIANNTYYWSQGASVVAALAVAGAATIGTTLTVTGLTTLNGGATIGTGLTVSVGGAAITGNSSVTGTFHVTGVTTLTGATHVVGAMDATTTITAGTGLFATTGGCTVTAGGLTVTAGGAAISGTTNINTATASTTAIGRGGTGLLNLGNLTANTSIWGLNVKVELGDAAGADKFQVLNNLTAVMASIDSTGNLVTDDSITATAGDIKATNGNIVLSAATTGITLPGPTRIISGAGVPANGLAVNAGDIYVNTTPTIATDRIFIATGAGVWTTITCAA